MSPFALTIAVAITAIVMICIAAWPYPLPTSWRKCPECLRWHRKGRVRYLTDTFIAHPEWKRCPACEAKRKPQPIP